MTQTTKTFTWYNNQPKIHISGLTKFEDIDGKHFYEYCGKRYPSVTTILSAQPKPKQLTDWIKKVGFDESERIKKNAARKGKEFHKIVETYLQNEYSCAMMPDVAALFVTIKPFLNNIDNIHCIEQILFSESIGIAGTTDCIAEYNGKLSVIDFKNARKTRTNEMIINYFLQCVFYGIMYTHMTNISVNQGVILMAVENDNPQEFVFDLRKYVKPATDVWKYYKNQQTKI